jgi:hypothetical protein
VTEHRRQGAAACLAAVRSGLFRCAGEGDRAGEVGHRGLNELRPSCRGGPAGPGDKGCGEHRGAGERCRADPAERASMTAGRHPWSMSTLRASWVRDSARWPSALQEHSASQPEVGYGLGALVPQVFGGANRGMAGNVCGLCTWPPGRSFQHEGLPGAGSVPRARPVGSRGRRPVRATRRGCPPANAAGALGAGAPGPRPRDYARSSGRGMERPPRSALLTQT